MSDAILFNIRYKTWNLKFIQIVVFPHRNPPHKVHNWENTVVEQVWIAG